MNTYDQIIKARDAVAHKLQALDDLHEWSKAQSEKHEALIEEYAEKSRELNSLNHKQDRF